MPPDSVSRPFGFLFLETTSIAARPQVIESREWGIAATGLHFSKTNFDTEKIPFNATPKTKRRFYERFNSSSIGDDQPGSRIFRGKSHRVSQKFAECQPRGAVQKAGR